MTRPILAVIDTNVIVSALISKSPVSPTVRVIEKIFDGIVTPVINDDIIREYYEVLIRPKFKFDINVVFQFIQSLKDLSIDGTRTEYNEALPDEDDRVFYEISLNKDSYLVTGNIKHFPKSIKVVTPKEFLEIIEK